MKLFLFTLFLLPLSAFADEVFKGSVACKGPYMMRPEVFEKYPEGSVTLFIDYDKLFKNSDVYLDINGRKTVTTRNLISLRGSCNYMSGNISLYYDCGTKEIERALIEVGNRSFINLNCRL